VHGTPVVAIALVHCGSLDDGERAVAPLRSLAEPILDHVGQIPYVAMQQALDPLWGRGAHNYFTSAFVDTLSDAAIDEALSRWRSKPTPQSELHLHHIGGAMSDVAPDATAFAHRSSPYICNVIARATDPLAFDEHAAWARAAREAMSGHGTGGVYVNFTGAADADKVRAAYPPATYARLVEVKRRYDPDNVFRLNQNISPAPLTE
jgi:hypothetical protein